MTALIATVFLASLLGSLHCAGMCGPFVAFAAGSRGRWLLAAYNVGRLITYSALGALAGLAGAALDLGGVMVGIQRGALLAAGVGMMLFGLLSLLRLRGVRVGTPGAPSFMRALFLRLQRATADFPAPARALSIGLLSTFLPCGWLYAFAMTAAGTGSAMLGATTMALFWLGTLPILVALGLGLQRLAGPARRHAPTLAALALMIVGLAAIAGRLAVPPLVAAEHLRADEALSLEGAVGRLEAGDGIPEPACHDSE